MKIVFGSGNKHKVFEVNEIAKDSGIEFVSPNGNFSPEEIGNTFEENSLIKSRAAASISGMISLADDSGLCIEALNGAPGLYSARYAGTQQEKIDRVLRELDGIENRNAKFVCCMSLVDKDGNVIHITTGECRGHIVKKQKGVNGFGYDPIFMPENSDITIAEMSEEAKNAISHRGRALCAMIKYIKENFTNV